MGAGEDDGGGETAVPFVVEVGNDERLGKFV